MIFGVLDKAYRNIWVPFFGRVLVLFVKQIEGKSLDSKPTYIIKDIAIQSNSERLEDK